MKEVFLINPPMSFVYGFKKDISSILPPMGLLSIASYLRENNHKVSFFDLEFQEDSDLLYGNIKKASIVGITLTTPSFIFASEIAKKIKNINPNCLIIGGGWHVTKGTWQTILDYDFDILIFGEGEYIFNKIINFYQGNENLSIEYFIKYAPRKIKKGIALKNKNNKKLYSGYHIIQDIDELPIPAYDIIDWRKYKPSAHRDLGNPFLPIITARGCPFSCRYCANNGNWRLYSVDYIRKIIIKMEEYFKTKFENLIIWDDTFTLPKERVKDMTNMLMEFNLNFSINTHPVSVNKDILLMLKKAGCKVIFYGIESYDKKILEGLGRKTSIEELQLAVELTKQVGILTSGSVMIGTPYDTKDSIVLNVLFLKEKIKPDLCFFSSFSIEPGTALYTELVGEGNIPPYNEWYEVYSSNNEFVNIPPPFIPSSNKQFTKSAIDSYVKWAYDYFYDSLKIEELNSKIDDYPFLNNIIKRIEFRQKT